METKFVLIAKVNEILRVLNSKHFDGRLDAPTKYALVSRVTVEYDSCFSLKT